jgi:hypothetical protein
VRFSRGGRGIGTGIRLDRGLVGADLEDVGLDLQAIHQRLVVKLGAARPGDDRAADRIDPGFGSMGSELDAIVGIELAIDEHRLVDRADLVHRRADPGEVDLPRAGELFEIEHDRLDPAVVRRRLDGADHVAGLIFLFRRGARKQELRRADRAALLDDGPVERDGQRPSRTCPATGRRASAA